MPVIIWRSLISYRLPKNLRISWSVQSSNHAVTAHGSSRSDTRRCLTSLPPSHLQPHPDRHHLPSTTTGHTIHLLAAATCKTRNDCVLASICCTHALASHTPEEDQEVKMSYLCMSCPIIILPFSILGCGSLLLCYYYNLDQDTVTRGGCVHIIYNTDTQLWMLTHSLEWQYFWLMKSWFQNPCSRLAIIMWELSNECYSCHVNHKLYKLCIVCVNFNSNSKRT